MTTKKDSEPSGTRGLSATDHQEIEWQFDVGELEPVESWLGQHSSGSSGLTFAPEPTLEIIDSYYNTDDWRFYQAGYALRVRKSDGDVEATMKALTSAEGSLRERREISKPLEDDLPAKRLGENPEELHNMRVPTRRMWAAMKVFEDAMPDGDRWLRQELCWVAQALGDIRDLNVLEDQKASGMPSESVR